VTIVLF